MRQIGSQPRPIPPVNETRDCGIRKSPSLITGRQLQERLTIPRPAYAGHTTTYPAAYCTEAWEEVREGFDLYVEVKEAIHRRQAEIDAAVRAAITYVADLKLTPAWVIKRCASDPSNGWWDYLRPAILAAWREAHR